MRSAEQRLAVDLPEGAAFDTQPLRINGRPATLEKGGQDEYYVPLVGANADQPFVLELRYTLRGDGSRLDLPGFPQEPAVIKAYLCVYLPETRTLLGVRGPWTRGVRLAIRQALALAAAASHRRRTTRRLGSRGSVDLRQSGAGFPDRRPTLRVLDVIAGFRPGRRPADDHARPAVARWARVCGNDPARSCCCCPPDFRCGCWSWARSSSPWCWPACSLRRSRCKSSTAGWPRPFSSSR